MTSLSRWAIALAACALSTPALAATVLVTPTSLNFGTGYTGATSPAQTVSITNTGAAPITPSYAGGAPTSGNFLASQNCAGVTLAPWASCQFFYAFAPTTTGAVTDSSNFTIDGTPYSVALQGFAVPGIVVSPTSLGFGPAYLGETSAQQVVNITNVSYSSQTPSYAGGAPTSGNFTASQNCAGVTLTPGASCQFFYALAPTETGLLTDSSNFTIDGDLFSVALSGFGLDPILVSPLALDFGAVAVGTTSPTQVANITNLSSVPQTPSYAGGAPTSGSFTAAQNCAGVTLAPGGSCQFFYAFAPTANGLVTDSSNFTVNGTPYMISLGGTGIGGVIAPVPLPASALLLFGAVALVAGLRRRA
ncbi:choice-of-anchor D domain-containing protein [Rhodobacterales bacterium HKCCE2091]|nr:choice-of-anchor D domain-containing protein [Rhodobacterales bacterium HKCCE2091]